jgi:hypothetical protein
VRDQHDGDAGLGGERAHQVGKPSAEDAVEPGVRLVQQQRAAAGQQQPPERDPVGLPAGQPDGPVGQQAPDAQVRRELAGARMVRVPAGPVFEVLPNGEVREQAGVLAEQADPPLPRRDRIAGRPGLGEHPAGQDHPPTAGRHQAGDRLQGGGLARARRAEQGQPLPGRHPQRHRDREIPPVNFDLGLEHGHSIRYAAGRLPAGRAWRTAPEQEQRPRRPS